MDRVRRFVFRRGVRYLAQSALFMSPDLRGEICGFLEALGVDHEALAVTMG